MADDATTDAAKDADEPSTTDDTTSADDAKSDVPEGADKLGDAGKKALDAMKAKWQKERDDRKARDARIAELEAEAAKGKKSDDKTDAPDVEELRKQAKAEAATELARERVLDKIEVKAARGFEDAADAAALLLREHKVDDFIDGDKIDVDAIEDALKELLKKKPYLAAQSGKKWQGSADGGARNGKSKPSQLTREDVKRLAAAGKHKEIEKARSEGQLDDLLSGK